MAADLRDEFGNTVQLTDEHGNPVQLTDEHGNPVHLTGLATKQDTNVGTDVYTGCAPGGDARGECVAAVSVISTEGVYGPKGAPATEPPTASYGAGTGLAGDRAGATQPLAQHLSQEGAATGEHRRSSSSSSSSSEDDGQGGRVKKKKGLGTKIKEKLTGGKHRDDQHHHPQTTTGPAATTTTMASHEHEKKSFMDKIKDKLPGHHHNTTN
ncbi:hypothetical protein FNV43_RR22834 [Rhamnella rubrinervis]|uniref:Dehydrin n=1 Tax=Rhamnella rubrinervis TaxID=2594499 RepID=A0A8K0E2N7_9ROSA|nr:hypothetical protein FNV43_RR22834 [Rhamnella rubrinervis]